MNAYALDMDTTRALGNDMEDKAASYLASRGLSLLGRQIRFKRGEIDLLMVHDNAIVFVEVRYRRHIKLGDGAQSVNWAKRERLKLAASLWLSQNPQYASLPCRFDVMSGRGRAESPQWTWYRDAFRT